MENTNVVNEVNEVEVSNVEAEGSKKKLGALGWALVITGGVLVIKGAKAVHRKWIKPAAEKRKAKKLGNNADTTSSDDVTDVE